VDSPPEEKKNPMLRTGKGEGGGEGASHVLPPCSFASVPYQKRQRDYRNKNGKKPENTQPFLWGLWRPRGRSPISQQLVDRVSVAPPNRSRHCHGEVG
jgi:hypothetical protein